LLILKFLLLLKYNENRKGGNRVEFFKKKKIFFCYCKF
jgi:hypothetical protein